MEKDHKPVKIGFTRLLLYLGIAFAVGESVQAQLQIPCNDILGPRDCLPGYKCQNGRCVPDSDPDVCQWIICGDGYRCVHGVCVPDRSVCRYSWDCAQNEICKNGKCVQREKPCRNGEECNGGRCEKGQCLPGEKPCRHNWECDGGRCEKGHCLRGGNICFTQSDCGRNERCKNRKCVSNDIYCSYDYECGLFERCRGGRCVNVTNSGRCRSDEDCPYGSCIWGICQDTIPTTPTSPLLCFPHTYKICPLGYRCHEGFCEREPTPTTPSIPMWCYPNSRRPCPPGYRCRGGLCERKVTTQPGTCRSDRQCRYPDRCIGGFCVPGSILG